MSEEQLLGNLNRLLSILDLVQEDLDAEKFRKFKDSLKRDLSILSGMVSFVNEIPKIYKSSQERSDMQLKVDSLMEVVCVYRIDIEGARRRKGRAETKVG